MLCSPCDWNGILTRTMLLLLSFNSNRFSVIYRRRKQQWKRKKDKTTNSTFQNNDLIFGGVNGFSNCDQKSFYRFIKRNRCVRVVDDGKKREIRVNHDSFFLCINASQNRISMAHNLIDEPINAFEVRWTLYFALRSIAKYFSSPFRYRHCVRGLDCLEFHSSLSPRTDLRAK